MCLDVFDQILNSCLSQQETVMWCNSSGSKSLTNDSWDQTTSVLEKLLRSCAQRVLLKSSYLTKMYMYVGSGKFTSMNNDNDLLFYIAY